MVSRKIEGWSFLLTFIFCFFSSFYSVFAQSENKTSRKSLPDSLYKKSMKHKMAIDFSGNNSSYSFNLNQGSNSRIFYPNLPGFFKLKLNYDFISIGVQFKGSPDNEEEVNRLKGKTNAFEIATSLIFKHWYSHLSYSSTTGYYLQNTRDYISGWTPELPYYQFPNFKHNRFYLSGGYIFNSKFSLKNILSQTERQLKSSGSFIPVFNFDYFIVLSVTVTMPAISNQFLFIFISMISC